MKKRTKLANRQLPDYYRGEEIMNMTTHIVGGGIGIIALVLCIINAALKGNAAGIITGCIFGVSMINLYTISSIYHGLTLSTAKKVLQVLDHCSIYLLIAGTYTPILVCGFLQTYPIIGWGLLILEWTLATVAITLTAIDLKIYNIFSMICYVFMGWSIIFFLPMAISALGLHAFYLILTGGILYTIGAILYGIGSRKHWFHSVFHIFVVLGSLFHALAIIVYVI